LSIAHGAAVRRGARRADLVSRRVAAAVEAAVRLEEIGDLALKGLMQAVAVYNIAAE
jgi:hypothetical protein